MSETLRKLHEAATPGPVQVAIMPASNVASCGPSEAIAMNVSGSFPRMVSHERGSYIAACDMELLAYMRNHASDFIALIEAAEAVLTNSETYTQANRKRFDLVNALDKFKDKP